METDRVEEIEEETPPIEVKKPSVKIRDARISDIPVLENLMFEFIHKQIQLGNKIYTRNEPHLRGGIVIELGLGFRNPMTKIIVADKNGEIVGLLIGEICVCDPTDRFANSIRIKADYMKENSLARGRILKKMWEVLERWGSSFGVGYYFGLIHPGNQPSIRAAKEVGFKHHTTQFLKVAETEEG